MTLEALWYVFVFWNVFGLVCLLATTVKFTAYGPDYDFDRLDPVYYYRNSKLNLFGCIVVTILRNLLCPIATAMYWFCKLFTIGR